MIYCRGGSSSFKNRLDGIFFVLNKYRVSLLSQGRKVLDTSRLLTEIKKATVASILLRDGNKNVIIEVQAYERFGDVGHCECLPTRPSMSTDKNMLQPQFCSAKSIFIRSANDFGKCVRSGAGGDVKAAFRCEDCEGGNR